MAHPLYEEFGKSRIPTIMAEVKNICDSIESAGITYWIDKGTLLGACRDGEYIKYDKDIDICFLSDGFDTVKTLCESNTNFQTIVHNYEIDPMIRLFWMENPTQLFSTEYLYVDMYPYIIIDGMVMENTPRGRATEGTSSLKKFPSSYLDNPSTIELCGQSFKCPSNPEEFISSSFRYGSTWRTEENDGSLVKSVELSINRT